MEEDSKLNTSLESGELVDSPSNTPLDIPLPPIESPKSQSNSSPSPNKVQKKAVLGIDKAKRRLKAFYFAKKAQEAKSADINACNLIQKQLVGNRKLDESEKPQEKKKVKKGLTPYEKAKATITEIEELKKNEAMRQTMYMTQSHLYKFGFKRKELREHSVDRYSHSRRRKSSKDSSYKDNYRNENRKSHNKRSSYRHNSRDRSSDSKYHRHHSPRRANSRAKSPSRRQSRNSSRDSTSHSKEHKSAQRPIANRKHEQKEAKSPPNSQRDPNIVDKTISSDKNVENLTPKETIERDIQEADLSLNNLELNENVTKTGSNNGTLTKSDSIKCPNSKTKILAICAYDSTTSTDESDNEIKDEGNMYDEGVNRADDVFDKVGNIEARSKSLSNLSPDKVRSPTSKSNDSKHSTKFDEIQTDITRLDKVDAKPIENIHKNPYENFARHPCVIQKTTKTEPPISYSENPSRWQKSAFSKPACPLETDRSPSRSWYPYHNDCFKEFNSDPIDMTYKDKRSNSSTVIDMGDYDNTKNDITNRELVMNAEPPEIKISSDISVGSNHSPSNDVQSNDKSILSTNDDNINNETIAENLVINTTKDKAKDLTTEYEEFMRAVTIGPRIESSQKETNNCIMNESLNVDTMEDIQTRNISDAKNKALHIELKSKLVSHKAKSRESSLSDFSTSSESESSSSDSSSSYSSTSSSTTSDSSSDSDCSYSNSEESECGRVGKKSDTERINRGDTTAKSKSDVIHKSGEHHFERLFPSLITIKMEKNPEDSIEKPTVVKVERFVEPQAGKSNSGIASRLEKNDSERLVPSPGMPDVGLIRPLGEIFHNLDKKELRPLIIKEENITENQATNSGMIPLPTMEREDIMETKIIKPKNVIIEGLQQDYQKEFMPLPIVIKTEIMESNTVAENEIFEKFENNESLVVLPNQQEKDSDLVNAQIMTPPSIWKPSDEILENQTVAQLPSITLQQDLDKQKNIDSAVESAIESRRSDTTVSNSPFKILSYGGETFQVLDWEESSQSADNELATTSSHSSSPKAKSANNNMSMNVLNDSSTQNSNSNTSFDINNICDIPLPEVSENNEKDDSNSMHIPEETTPRKTNQLISFKVTSTSKCSLKKPEAIEDDTKISSVVKGLFPDEDSMSAENDCVKDIVPICNQEIQISNEDITVINKSDEPSLKRHSSSPRLRPKSPDRSSKRSRSPRYRRSRDRSHNTPNRSHRGDYNNYSRHENRRWSPSRARKYGDRESSNERCFSRGDRSPTSRTETYNQRDLHSRHNESPRRRSSSKYDSHHRSHNDRRDSHRNRSRDHSSERFRSSRSRDHTIRDRDRHSDSYHDKPEISTNEFTSYDMNQGSIPLSPKFLDLDNIPLPSNFQPDSGASNIPTVISNVGQSIEPIHPAVSYDNSFYNEPLTNGYPEGEFTETSPKRISLDARIDLVLGRGEVNCPTQEYCVNDQYTNYENNYTDNNQYSIPTTHETSYHANNSTDFIETLCTYPQVSPVNTKRRAEATNLVNVVLTDIPMPKEKKTVSSATSTKPDTIGPNILDYVEDVVRLGSGPLTILPPDVARLESRSILKQMQLFVNDISQQRRFTSAPWSKQNRKKHKISPQNEQLDDNSNQENITTNMSFPTKSALAGFRKPSPLKKVKFADGIFPGEGTSTSGGDEMASPPPEQLEKERIIKRRRNIFKKQKLHKNGEFDLEDLPPPPPPEGDPPPFLLQPCELANNAALGFKLPPGLFEFQCVAYQH